MATALYQEQFERTKRYLAKFKSINDGKLHDQPSAHYDDDVYAFFQNCFHLKDWIKNDATCIAWSNVENFIRGNTDLQICGDLCIALKHLVQTRRPHSTESPKFTGNDVTVEIEEGIGIQGLGNIYQRQYIGTLTLQSRRQ